MSTAGRAAPAHLGALYPFLYAQPAPTVDAFTAELVVSTAGKLREAALLRAQVLTEQGEALAACARSLAVALDTGGRLFAFGNGGSATDAQACADLFAAPPHGYGAPSLAAYALSADVAVLSALANDVGVEAVFARQVAAHARPGDVAVGFSTSGNSPNLVAAFDRARRCGMVTVGFSGGGGGRLAEPGAVDHLFVVRSPSVHRIQEAQTTACHVLWELTVAELCGADGRPSAAQGVLADDRNTGAACAGR
ncbi:D-sedoheptulose-7-phosphate isomerase [Catellatospora chokoriensis]|uniref:Phosphoheptose isomerase n=1 Tax=Catellatospora chokoriensis TaxID=310353 RepID=A0A8J3K644_9ACTN|nr:SIS domain-containing protein [Catellatospora chokoriensis]GIF93841.1 phosphoheptose isomerase [Catellatospora chokoriensis]